MDTLVGDLLQLVNKHLDVVNSILFGNREDYDLINNKKWMVYYINSNEAGFYNILKTLDLKTLMFLETHNDRHDVIFEAMIKKMLSLDMAKETVVYMSTKTKIHVDRYKVWFLWRKLIKTRKHNKVIIALTKYLLGQYDQNGHTMDVKIIEDVYHYGDQSLIKHYEQFVFSDGIHFRYKFIGLVKSGQNVDELIQRFEGDVYHTKIDRHVIIMDLLKYQQYNNVVVKLLAQFEGDTIEDQIKMMINFIDDRFNHGYPTLMSLYSRVLNNIEMCRILTKIANKRSDVGMLKIMLDQAIYNNNREIYDLIRADHPELKFCFPPQDDFIIVDGVLLKRSHYMTNRKIDVEFFKYVLNQGGGINEEKRQTMSRLLVENGNIDILEFIQNYK